MLLAPARRFGLFLFAATLGAGCPADPTCEADEVLVDGVCEPVPVDSEDTEPTDPLDGRDVLDATLVIEWEVKNLPNENTIELVCDGRVVYDETDFVVDRTYTYQTVQPPGQRCFVRMSDERGGALAAGRVVNCSNEVARWEQQRGYEEVVAEFTAMGCVRGCNDPIAENYDEVANLDDGSCIYILGCTDARALNYDPAATKDNGRCDFGGFGNVEVSITTDAQPTDTGLFVRCDGFNVLSRANFTIPNQQATFSVIIDAGFDCQVIVADRGGDDGPGGSARVCGQTVATWSRTTAATGNPGQPLGPYEAALASFFMPACSGCTDPTAVNYDPTAYVEDGSCQSAAP
jgi:hypothetical protein